MQRTSCLRKLAAFAAVLSFGCSNPPTEEKASESPKPKVAAHDREVTNVVVRETIPTPGRETSGSDEELRKSWEESKLTSLSWAKEDLLYGQTKQGKPFMMLPLFGEVTTVELVQSALCRASELPCVVRKFRRGDIKRLLVESGAASWSRGRSGFDWKENHSETEVVMVQAKGAFRPVQSPYIRFVLGQWGGQIVVDSPSGSRILYVVHRQTNAKFDANEAFALLETAPCPPDSERAVIQRLAKLPVGENSALQEFQSRAIAAYSALRLVCQE